MKLLIENVNLFRGSKNPLSISIDGDRIVSVGEVPEGIVFDKTIDGSNYIALPGLVNAHTHAPMTILRNVGNDLPFSDWLFKRIIPLEAKLTSDDIYYGTLLAICEMIRSGVTCFCDMYINTENIARAISEIGIRANIAYSLITSSVRGGKEYINEEGFRDFVSSWNNKGNIKVSAEIHSTYLYEKESIIEATALIKSLGIGCHTHLSETKGEVENSISKYSMTPIEAAASFSMFDTPTIAAHCVHPTDNDLSILKENNVNVVHCPTSNLKLACGFAPVEKMLEKGINVAIGTDGAASNNNLNMFEEMHITSLIHKGISGNPTCLNASTVLDMATINGAKAAGFSDLGEIKEGNLADIVLVDMKKPHMYPINDLEAALIYTSQASDVDTVIVGGKILMEKGIITFCDEESIMAKVDEIHKRIVK